MFELYLAPSQQNGDFMYGDDLEKHLQETGLINRCLGLEDEEVKGWLDDPSTFPAELKEPMLTLWKSARGSHLQREVPILAWDYSTGDFTIRWIQLSNMLSGPTWGNGKPALLKTES